MRTNDNLHIEELDRLTFPIKYKDEVVQIFRLGYKRGRDDISLRDKLKAYAVIALLLFLTNVVTYNIAASPTVSDTTEPIVYKDNFTETVENLIRRYETENHVVFYDYSRGKVQDECMLAEPTEWWNIVKKYGEQIKGKGVSVGGKPN